MKIILSILITLLFSNSFGQTVESIVKLETDTGIIEGSMLLPKTETAIPVTLIIAGSGPTDRDGNNLQMKNNSLKMLAEGLAENGIASIRYDKRGIGKSRMAGMREIDLRFDIYVEDAKDWIALLKNDDRFSEVIVIGHSEGSLIGIIASEQAQADKFVSLAGVGEPAGKIIRKQLEAQPPILLEKSLPVIEKLENGEKVDTLNPILNSIFRKSIQPYLISWFKYDPQEEIRKLNIPILIVQGTNDIQVGVEEAEKLSAAKPEAEKHIIDGMNHILKDSEMERGKNMQTYSQPDLPLSSGLVELIEKFIKGAK